MNILEFESHIEIENVEVNVGTFDSPFYISYRVTIPLKSDSFDYEGPSGLVNRKCQVPDFDSAKAFPDAIGGLANKQSEIEAIDKAVLYYIEQPSTPFLTKE